MEDFVTWVDSSKLKRAVMEYNDEVRLPSLPFRSSPIPPISSMTLIFCSVVLYIRIEYNCVCSDQRVVTIRLDILRPTTTEWVVLLFLLTPQPWPRLEMATSKSSSAAAPSTPAVRPPLLPHFRIALTSPFRTRQRCQMPHSHARKPDPVRPPGIWLNPGQKARYRAKHNAL